jgi:hypothetical protein
MCDQNHKVVPVFEYHDTKHRPWQSWLGSWRSHFAILLLTHWTEDWVYTTAVSRNTAMLNIQTPLPAIESLCPAHCPSPYWMNYWSSNRWSYICIKQHCKQFPLFPSIKKYVRYLYSINLNNQELKIKRIYNYLCITSSMSWSMYMSVLYTTTHDSQEAITTI